MCDDDFLIALDYLEMRESGLSDRNLGQNGTPVGVDVFEDELSDDSSEFPTLLYSIFDAIPHF